MPKSFLINKHLLLRTGCTCKPAFVIRSGLKQGSSDLLIDISVSAHKPHVLFQALVQKIAIIVRHKANVSRCQAAAAAKILRMLVTLL